MADEKAAPQGRNPMKTILVVLAMIAIFVLAGAAWWFHSHRSTVKAESAKPVIAVKSVLHLESFVVNLADDEGSHFLRVGIDLGLGTEAESKKDKPSPIGPVRDVIISVISARKSEELLSGDGRARLKQELLGALQEHVADLEVREVYLTDFIIQR